MIVLDEDKLESINGGVNDYRAIIEGLKPAADYHIHIYHDSTDSDTFITKFHVNR